MSDKGSIPMPRGVLWRTRKSGDPAGDPLAQFAYVTPRFPNGITATALRNQSILIKQETALVWFWANLKPYSLPDPPYVTLGQPLPAKLAPDKVTALEALLTGFATSLDATLRSELAAALPGDWMWRDQPSTAPETILARLDDLAAAIRQMHPAPGQMGHNQPDFWSAADQVSALDTIAEARRQIEQRPDDAVLVIEEHKSFFAAWAPRLRVYAADLLDRYVKNAMESAGKATGPLLVVGAVAALLGWHGAEWLMRLGH